MRGEIKFGEILPGKKKVKKLAKVRAQRTCTNAQVFADVDRQALYLTFPKCPTCKLSLAGATLGFEQRKPLTIRLTVRGLRFELLSEDPIRPTNVWFDTLRTTVQGLRN